MADMVFGFINGRLTRNPEVDVTNGGQAFTKFTVACNQPGWENGEKTETVTFFGIKTFGRTAEQCGQMLHKGSRVNILGRQELAIWIDNEGKARLSATIVAAEVQFLDPKPQAESGNGPGLATAAASSAGKPAAGPALAAVAAPVGAIQQQLAAEPEIDPDDIPF